MKSRWIWFAVALAIFGGAIVVYRGHRRPPGPFKTAFWYWQTPYTLSNEDVDGLKKLDVKQVFVRAGTFSSDGQNIVLIIPQKYGEGANRLPIHLVFNADAGVIRHFEDYDVARISQQISDRLVIQVDAAKKAGANVIGVQLDFDIATRLLPKYADLIARIRKSNPLFQRHKGFFFSLTGLMSWLGTRGVERLSDEVDFMVPQAYEGSTGRTPADMRPVFDPVDTDRRLGKAERLNCPYWIGIPSYGHAFLYDDHDHLVGTYRNLEAQDALRHPSFQLIEAYGSDKDGKPAKSEKEWMGEEILKFKAIHPAPSGYGQNFTLAYSLPSPEVTTQAMAMVRESRGSNCQGVIIYRMPETGSTFTNPLSTLEIARDGKKVEPKVEVSVTRSQDTYEAIEGNLDIVPIDLFVEVQNTGTGSTFVSPDAMDVSITIDKPGFGDVRLRTFDTVSFDGDNPARASTIHLRKGFSYPGQKLSAGPIRLLASGDLHVKIRWRLRRQSGLSFVDGEQPEIVLKSREVKANKR